MEFYVSHTDGISHSVQAAVIRFLIEGGKVNAVPESR